MTIINHHARHKNNRAENPQTIDPKFHCALPRHHETCTVRDVEEKESQKPIFPCEAFDWIGWTVSCLTHGSRPARNQFISSEILEEDRLNSRIGPGSEKYAPSWRKTTTSAAFLPDACRAHYRSMSFDTLLRRRIIPMCPT